MQQFVHLKSTPRIDRRYWAGLLIASMCGANLGDVTPDILHFSPAVALPVLTALFAILLFIDRLRSKKSEVFYWVAILIVRAAASDIADFSADVFHRNYLAMFAASAALFILLVALRPHSGSGELTSDAIVADGTFWLTMLLAGTSGTIFADGLGHAFSSVEIGVPASALMSTAYLVAAFAMRSRRAWQLSVSYWAVVFGVRWWGTSFGDILAFVTTLTISLAITTGSLIAVLAILRGRADKTSGIAEQFG